MVHSKFEKYGRIAEHKYVEELKSTSEISHEIPVADRTLRKWKDEYHWDEKRKKKLRTLKNIGAKLYQAAERILDRFLLFLEDPKENEPITDIEERILRDALSKLPTFSKYEKTKAEETKKKDTPARSKDELLNQILERFL